MDAVSSSTLAISFEDSDRYRAWNPEDLDGDGVKDGESLVGEQGKVYSEKDINAKLKPHGLQIVGGGLQSLDGFAINSDNALAVTDHSSYPLPALDGTAATPSELGSKLDWMQSMAGIEGAALMWLALSTMAHSSMREMKDAKEIKHALQKGKLEAKDAEIRSEQNRIDAERADAAKAFAVAVVVAVIQAFGAKMSAGGNAMGGAVSAAGQAVQAGYKAYSVNDGDQAKANEARIRGMQHQKEQEMLQMGIDDAQASYDDAREQFRMALKIMSEHVERQSQVVQTVTRS